MTNNYYTPELEELYVGYICEIDEPVPDNTEDYMEWIEKEIDYYFYFQDYHNCNRIRTKYLDAADIESLGFKYDKTIRNGIYYIKDNIGLIHIPEDNILMLYKVIEGINQNEMLFQGNCKSINELKKIIKYLGC